MLDMNRWPRMKWALAASIGLNVVLAGIIGGALLKGPPPPPPVGLWYYGRALPEPYKRDLGQALRDNRRDWIDQRNALNSQRAAVADALVAEPFDIGAVQALLDKEPPMVNDLAMRGTRLLIEQIRRMDPEERAAYSESLRRQKAGPPKGPPRP